MSLKLFIASDHAGVDLKDQIIKDIFLRSLPMEWVDLGPNTHESVDYPSYAQKLCSEVLRTFDNSALLEPCGVLICGSGIGVSISANRFSKIRAALCWTPEIAKLSRQHNASNVLCLSARNVDPKTNIDIIKVWLSTKFEGGRHAKRIDGIETIFKNDPQNRGDI